MANLLQAFKRFFQPPPVPPPAGLRTLQLISGSQYQAPTVASLTSTHGRHPILQITDRLPGSGLTHGAQLLLFHAMREYIPTLSAVILNRRQLEGRILIASDDEALQAELQDWLENVPVGFIGANNPLQGLDTYLQMLSESADEYGMGVGEIRLSEDGRGIERLVVPNTRTFSLKDEDKNGVFDLYQRQDGRDVPVDSPLVQLLAFSASTETVWPAPLAWGLPFPAEILLRMMESVVNAWWRYGDGSGLYGLEYDREASLSMSSAALPDGTSISVPQDILNLRDSIDSAMQKRKIGQVADVYYWASGAKLNAQILGEGGTALLEFYREHATVLDGYIIARSETPAWMYPSAQTGGDGLNASKAQQEALVASVAAEKRNRVKRVVAREVLDTYLLAQRRDRDLARYEIAFDAVSVLDDKFQAEAEKIAAEARAQTIANAVQLYDEDGRPRFQGEALAYLEREGILHRSG